MGILSDFLSVKGPVVGIGYGAMKEMYDQANIKAGDQQRLFQGLGQDLRVERSANNKMLNEKLSNFRSTELDFIQNAEKYNPAYAGFSDDKLKSIFAPMSEYLKGDTFLGKQEDIQKKITMALELSGGIKVDDPYTPFKEFETKTKQAINKPLEMYSGLAYNTWQNQVGDLSYETPEYDQTAKAMDGLRITAYNFPQFYPTQGQLESPAMTVARMSVLNYNARQDATDANGVFDPWKFDELRKDRFEAIKDSVDITNAAALFGIKEDDFMRLVTAESPFLKNITSMSSQLSNPNLPIEERNAIIQNVGGAILQHMDFLTNVKEGLFEKVITKESIDTKEGEKLAKTILKVNFADNAYKIHDAHVTILNKANVNAVGGTTSNLGIILPANAASNKIPENDGRVQEQFSFISVIQGMKDEVALPKKWLITSSTGVVFEMPNMAAIEQATRKKYMNTVGNIPAEGVEYQGITLFPKVTKYGKAGTSTVEDFNMPNAELKLHAMTAITLAMEGYLKLTFVSKSGDQYIEDSRAVKALESAGVFGKNSTTGMPVKYFGQ